MKVILFLHLLMTNNFKDYFLSSFEIPRKFWCDFGFLDGKNQGRISVTICVPGEYELLIISSDGNVFLDNFVTKDGKTTCDYGLEIEPANSISLKKYNDYDLKWLSQTVNNREMYLSGGSSCLANSLKSEINLKDFVLKVSESFSKILIDTFSEKFEILDTGNKTIKVNLVNDFLFNTQNSFNTKLFEVNEMIDSLSNLEYDRFDLTHTEVDSISKIIKESSMVKLVKDLGYELSTKQDLRPKVKL